MKRILTIMLNGDPMPSLLMHIIRFVMPSKSKSLKKLLYFYYEICPKLDAGGKLKQEMILVWYSARSLSIQGILAYLFIAMAFATTYNIPTNIFEEILLDFCVSFEKLSSLNLSFLRLDLA